MEITIHASHFTPSQDLKEYAETSVAKLAHFYHSIKAADVYLKLDNAAVTWYNECEIRLVLPGHELFAKKESNTFEKAISETIDALKQQIEKLKSKEEKHPHFISAEPETN